MQGNDVRLDVVEAGASEEGERHTFKVRSKPLGASR